MASKRVVKSAVDWVELGNRLRPTKKPKFVAFKGKCDGLLRKVIANPEESPKIDWAYYKANAENKAIIEQLEKQYSALKIPYPSDNEAIAKIEAEEKIWREQYNLYVNKSNERIKKYEEEIEAVRNAESYDDMTEEEFAYVHPNLQIDFLNRPTHMPHSEEFQLNEEDLAFWRKNGMIYPGPDKYYK